MLFRKNKFFFKCSPECVRNLKAKTHTSIHTSDCRQKQKIQIQTPMHYSNQNGLVLNMITIWYNIRTSKGRRNCAFKFEWWVSFKKRKYANNYRNNSAAALSCSLICKCLCTCTLNLSCSNLCVPFYACLIWKHFKFDWFYNLNESYKGIFVTATENLGVLVLYVSKIGGRHDY